jgi:ATP-binding cassette subfamily B protein
MKINFPSSPDVKSPDLPGQPARFILYFVRRNLYWLLLTAALQAVSAAAGIATPYALGSIVGVIAHGKPAAGAFSGPILKPLVMFVVLNIIDLVFGRGSAACRVVIAPRQRTLVSGELYAYLQHHSHRYVSDNFAGALAHRISEAALGVNMAVWAVIFDFLPIAVTLLVAIVLLTHTYAPLGGAMLLWSCLFVAISFVLAKAAQPYSTRHAQARSDTTGAIVDGVGNLLSVRLFARLGFERARIDRFLARERVTSGAYFRVNERTAAFQFTAAALLKLGTIVYTLLLWRDGKVSVGGVVMSMGLSMLVINEARNLSRRFLEFFEYIGNIANSVRTIVRPHEVIDAPGAKDLSVTQGAIHFDNVTFGYLPDRPVFRNLELTVQAGERVGLVGFSGSGKSTLINLVLRLYEPQGGRITIDGQDINAVTQRSLHSQISLIPQEPGLFHRTLKENIGYGRLDADDTAIEQAARQAHAHEFIAAMPTGYDSMVGERGVKLSGGQRQRIAIARVIAKNAPILIMDEATSSLDSITEKAIQDSLDTLMHGKTVLVVAHRLSTIAHLDRILVFDDGRIVEDGSHQALLAQDGAYRRLWSRQADGMIPDKPDLAAA